MNQFDYRKLKGECNSCLETVSYWWVGPTLDGWDHVLQCPVCRELETMCVSEGVRDHVARDLKIEFEKP